MEPLWPQRDAEVFEQLRERCAGFEVQLFALGSEASAAGRIGFAQTLFATASVTTTRVEQPAPGVVCICGSDGVYQSELEAAIAKCKAVGARILIAGRPKLEDESLTCLDLRTNIPALMDSLLEVSA